MKRQDNIQFESQVSEIELMYKTKVRAAARLIIRDSKDAEKIFRNYWNKNTLELQEEMKALYFNQAGHVLGIYSVSKGSITGTVVDCRLILIAALRLGAIGCILCHSHPTGSLKPSKFDKQLTEKIKLGAALVDIQLADHIILTKAGYFSFAEEGLL